MLNTFLIGCCYYPEQWEKENLKSDLERIKDLGFNCIRMGEFSWSMYEREEGRYDFSLLLEAVTEAERLGLFVILGTPTAAPPRWLTEKYPEVLCTNYNGVVMQHGSRQHHNHTSEIYLKYCAAITEAMVKHFAEFSNVIGWQIDNEFNCHRNESYSETDDIAFSKWLKEKYKTIENLNKCWGNRFWSLDFNSFSQITCPRPSPAYPNPSWMTDYYLFLSDSVISFASLQTKIIRKYMPNAFITHNGYFENLDYKKLTKECLDILSFDSYPAGLERRGQGGERNVAYKMALTRSCSEKFLILEQQSGPGGQLSYMHSTPRPGQIRMWTYQSIAHGATGILYFRYRTALYGAEQLWYGIYDHDREENYRSREIRQVAKELNRLGDLFLKERQHNEVAIYSDYHNTCLDKVESFAENDDWYIFLELNRQNIHADFIDMSDTFEKYKVIVFPHITVANEALAERIERFTQNGGIALISARSGVKDENAHFLPCKAPGVFRSLAGCSVDWFTALAAHETQSVVYRDKTYEVSHYYEMLVPEEWEAVGWYTDGFCKQKPAIVKHKNVYYLGFYSNASATLYSDIIKNHITYREQIDRNLEEIDIGTYTLYLNHGSEDIEHQGYDEIKGETFEKIPPFGVVLVKRANS